MAQSGTDAYQRIAFSAPVQLSGGTYYVGVQCNNTSARLNTHAGIGNWGTTKRTGMTFGTFSALTPPTTFTANVGPRGSLYSESELPLEGTPGATTGSCSTTE